MKFRLTSTINRFFLITYSNPKLNYVLWIKQFSLFYKKIQAFDIIRSMCLASTWSNFGIIWQIFTKIVLLKNPTFTVFHFLLSIIPTWWLCETLQGSNVDTYDLKLSHWANSVKLCWASSHIRFSKHWFFSSFYRLTWLLAQESFLQYWHINRLQQIMINIDLSNF
jgi:hypothetical protein